MFCEIAVPQIPDLRSLSNSLSCCFGTFVPFIQGRLDGGTWGKMIKKGSDSRNVVINTLIHTKYCKVWVFLWAIFWTELQFAFFCLLSVFYLRKHHLAEKCAGKFLWNWDSVNKHNQEQIWRFIIKDGAVSFKNGTQWTHLSHTVN